MDLEIRTCEARAYVIAYASEDIRDTINDAANIFASSYEEYLAIWEALEA